MKRFLYITTALLLTSCASIRVSTDYDTSVDFTSYNAYAFFKPGIDDAKISDLDKRRILKAIENTLTEKGFDALKHPKFWLVFIQNQKKTCVLVKAMLAGVVHSMALMAAWVGAGDSIVFTM